MKQLGCFCWTEGRFEGGERKRRKREGGGDGSGKEAERKETEKNKMRGSTNIYRKMEKTYGNSFSTTMSKVEEVLALSKIYIQRANGSLQTKACCHQC